MFFHPIRGRLGLFLLFALGLLQVGCRQQEHEWQPLVPGGEADLVVVLNSDLTYQELRNFHEEELIEGSFEESYWHRPGIDGTMQLAIDGHEAFVVFFDSAATSEQRTAILEGVRGSPYVYRIFENVNPWELELDESVEQEGNEADQDSSDLPSD